MADGKIPRMTKRGIFGRGWRRVVLDEGHTIRNSRAKVSLAASSLDAVCRWSLTGTPIINSLSDLYSQLRYLHFTGGLAEQELFTRLITRPLKNGDPAAAGKLQLLLSGCCLRRRKDMVFGGRRIVELPEMKEYLHKIGKIQSSQCPRFLSWTCSALFPLVTLFKAVEDSFCGV